MCSLQLCGNHELKLNTGTSLSFNLRAVVREDGKAEGSQGGRDFLVVGLSRLATWLSDDGTRLLFL